MLKVALFGAGRIGQVHARSLSTHPDCRLVAVADVGTAAAQKLATQHAAAVRSVEKSSTIHPSTR